ncbi:MAG: F0F1 ATP synthase subunit B [Bacteroidales bacterium]|nr:F0F1 ATP synthase subunit B [Bacteroidales bacterium]
MDLFLPESGLVIWMLIAFLIVFVILAKAGWPMIMGAVEKRNAHISESLLAADEANKALAGIEQKKQETMAAAQAEQIRIMKESQELKAQVVEEAKLEARKEAEKIVADARLKIEKEQAEAMAQIKNEVIALSVDIAEKLLQRELSDKPSQSAYIEQLLKNNHPQIQA